MTRFYTRTGDDGSTGLLGEGRVPKYHPRTEAVGAVDEANAALGVARAACQVEQCKTLILAVQKDLYGLMGELSAVPEHARRFRVIDTAKVAWLEEQADAISAGVEVRKEFIVPGDIPSSAALDLARTIVRRAERRVVLLYHQQEIENGELLRYLNRLSSLCFVLELLEIQAAGKSAPTFAKDKL